MRYARVETVSFEAIDGNVYPVKELREIPTYAIGTIVERAARDDVDDTASRDEVFGGGGEGESYRLWEANAVEIADSGYDLTRVKSFKVPLT